VTSNKVYAGYVFVSVLFSVYQEPLLTAAYTPADRYQVVV